MAKSSIQVIKGLGKKIQKLRKEKGFIQEDLAEQLRLSRTYIGYIEQGREIPSLKLLIRIASKLEVHIGDLFKK